MIYYTIKLCFSCLKFSLPAHFTVFPYREAERKDAFDTLLGGEVLQIWERHRVLWSLTAGMMSCFQETSPLGMWQKKQQVMNCGPPPGPEILEGGAGHRNQSGFSQEVCVAQGGGWSVKDWCLWSQGFPKALDTWNLSSLCHPPPGTRNAGIMGLNFPAGERIRYLCQENKVGASCSPFLLL